MSLSPQTQADIDALARKIVYDHFILNASSPSRATVASGLSISDAEAAASFNRLAQAHLLVLQPQSGEILMANPFSAVPTPFRVTSEGRQWWGNCIWDALGILAMISEDGPVASPCPDCGEALTLAVSQGILAERSAIVHFAIPAAHWWDDIVFT